MKNEKRDKIFDLVYNYKTKYKQGFIQDEIEDILKNFPNINMDKFNNALNGITCIMEDDNMIIYHCDIETALKCGIENRDMYSYEWD